MQVAPRSRRSLDFARALALLGGLAGCASSAPAPVATTTSTTSGGEPVDRCAVCVCDSSSVNPPYCDTNGHSGCCARVPVVRAGPLPPPDLPA